jgi:hypothetical protein
LDPILAAIEAPASVAVQAAASQLLAEATYRAIAGVLDPRGIDHLVLKGPHLGAMVYDEAWQRDYGDLDLLIREGQFEEALSALLSSGFTLKAPPAGREATIATAYDRGVVSPHGWLVELHRAFSPYGLYRVDYDALFARAVPFRFGGVEARGLAVEDLLLHLVIHAAKSQFFAIEPKHVQDVALLVARQPIEWETFLTQAEGAGCRTAAWVLLSAAVTIDGAKIPEEVLDRLRPSRARRWWLGLWLTWQRFPLFRWDWLPSWLRWLVVTPAVVNGFWHGAAIGLRFAGLRLRDVAGGVTRR